MHRFNLVLERFLAAMERILLLCISVDSRYRDIPDILSCATTNKSLPSRDDRSEVKYLTRN